MIDYLVYEYPYALIAIKYAFLLLILITLAYFFIRACRQKRTLTAIILGLILFPTVAFVGYLFLLGLAFSNT